MVVKIVLRITIYGWIISPPDPIHGAGSGALCDLVYFVSDDNVSVRDIFGIVEHAGYKIVSKKISGTKIHESDRIIVESWDAHIKIGTEKMPEGITFEENKGYYDRYNYPYSGGMI